MHLHNNILGLSRSLESVCYLLLYMSGAAEDFGVIKQRSTPELEHLLQGQGLHLLEGVLHHATLQGSQSY